MTTPTPITPPPMNAETREAILQRDINHYLAQGYQVVSQTGHTVQLRRPKKFSLFWSIFWLIFGFGIGFVVYILYYLAKRDETIYIDVLPSGQKTFQHTGSMTTSGTLLIIGAAVLMFGCAACIVSGLVFGSIDPGAVLTNIPPTP